MSSDVFLAVASCLAESCSATLAAVARLLALMLFSWASFCLFRENHAGLLIRARLLQRFAPITAWLILLVVGGGLARW
jgi:hypothetical protein